MPRLLPVVMSFATGEVTPTVYAREDIAKYQNGVQLCRNYLPIPQGGVERRPGLRFVAEVKDSSKLTVARRFEFSTTQAYALELGCTYMRFYKNSARVETSGTPTEIVTPYAPSQLYDLDFVQSADVLYHFHASCDTRKLERYADTCWRFRTVRFKPPPTFEYGARPVSDLEVNFTPSAGTDILLTAHNVAQTFYASDVGREVLVLAGASNAGARAGIKTISSATQVIATVCEPWVSLTVTCNGFWKITESPKTTATISAATPTGALITIQLGAPGFRGTTAELDTDCGRFAHIFGGTFELTCIQSTSLANAVIRGEASSASAAAQAGVWSLEESLWSTVNGFAETADFDSDRLWANAGFRLVGSKTSDYENFGIGVNDDDSVNFPINSKTINSIRAIVGGRKLQVFTAGGEFVFTGGGIDDPITPTNVRNTSETTHGSRGVQPIRVGDVTLFVPKGGKQLREFTIPTDSVAEVYRAPDLLLLADHITRDTTIVDLAYQREPKQIVWAVLADGRLASCTYRREENVVAWSVQETCGAFESVMVIPHPDGDRDQVYVTTRRTINGSTKRFVEYFDDCTFYYRSRHTDCCITCNPGSAVTVVGGLNHLVGMTVAIQGDGSAYPDQEVSSCGQVTISPAASKIEVGLPYTSTLTLLRPAASLGGQSSMFKQMRWAEIDVKLFETLGMSLGTDSTTKPIIPFRSASTNFGEPEPLFSGDKRISHLGWDCGVITLLQSQPLPSTVLAIGGILDLGD